MELAVQEITLEALASCEGFGIYGPSGRIGTVEAVARTAEGGRPALLSVRAGLHRSWLVHVPVDQVEEVSLDERRVVLRSGALLSGPRRPGAARRPDASTRAG
jgi:hypothetical protein